MKQLFTFKLSKSTLVFTAIFVLLTTLYLLPAKAQAPSQTANSYVKPYTALYQFGFNTAYYGNGWDDYGVATLMKKAGGNSLRTTLPDAFLKKWGYTIRLQTFKDYVEKLKMNEITVFVETPVEANRDKTKFPGCDQESKIFKNLYEPIWNSNGTVNTNNYYADYIYNTVKVYGPYVKIWEVWNEPDITNGDPGQWYTRNPTPCELYNLNAPLSHYIRMLRITYEVVKKYDPDDYIATGGIGYGAFLDAVLRNTDNPGGGTVTSSYPRKGGAYFDILSFHFYPSYSLRKWDNAIMNFRYFRNSDKALEATFNARNEFLNVLNKYGYNGTTYPAKPLIITETNVPKKTYEWRYGSDDMQRNYVMKMSIKAAKGKISQVDHFVIGDGADINTSTNEYNLMGAFENLTRDKPGTEKLTPAGIGHQTVSKLLYGLRYDPTITGQMALPTNVDGAAFKQGTNVVYALWAKTVTDQSENASANYRFPSVLKLATVKKYSWNYSQTGGSAILNAQGTIALGGTPSFFIMNTPAATTLASAGSVTNTLSSLNAPGQNTTDLNSEEVKAYPNPFTDKVYLNLAAYDDGNSTNARLQLIDMGGAVLKTQTLNLKDNASNVEMNFQQLNLKPGVYLIKLSGEDLEDKTFKVIKN